MIAIYSHEKVLKKDTGIVWGWGRLKMRHRWRSGAYGITVTRKAIIEVAGALGRGLSRRRKFATQRPNAVKTGEMI